MGIANMIEVTRYAPVRIIMVGLGRMIIGAVPLALAALIVVATTTSTAAPSAADPPPWLFAAIAAFFLFIGLVIFSSGVGRIASAFARNCYLRAGPQGTALRLPVQGWFGRFRVREIQLRWSEIGELVHFTYRINGIPTSRELRIRPRTGALIKIPRYVFSDSSDALQDRLHQIMARRTP